MKKKYISAVFIACLVFAAIVCLSSVDFSPIPKAKIINIDSSIIAQILSQKEAELNDLTIIGGMGANSAFKKAIDRALAHNYQTVTAEYELELGFGAKCYCRDIIFLDTRQKGQTVLSVKCKRKDDTSPWSTGPSYLFGSLFSKYKRDYGREYVIMSETIQELRTDHKAQIEWLGKWRPENSKCVWPSGPPGAPSYHY